MYALFLFFLCNSHFKLFVSIVIIGFVLFIHFSYGSSIIWLNMLFAVHFTEACKTYHRSHIDARTRRINSTAEEHKQTCRRKGQKRDVSLL